MATLFSNAFPGQGNTTDRVPYLLSGGVVKVAAFAYVVPAGGVAVTTASRLNLFLLPLNSMILRGWIDVSVAFGTGTACNLVASAAPDFMLWGSGGVNLATAGLYEVDRFARGALYNSPPDIPESIRANGGIRIALAPVANGTFAAGGTLRGCFLYV